MEPSTPFLERVHIVARYLSTAKGRTLLWDYCRRELEKRGHHHQYEVVAEEEFWSAVDKFRKVLRGSRPEAVVCLMSQFPNLNRKPPHPWLRMVGGSDAL